MTSNTVKIKIEYVNQSTSEPEAVFEEIAVCYDTDDEKHSPETFNDVQGLDSPHSPEQYIEIIPQLTEPEDQSCSLCLRKCTPDLMLRFSTFLTEQGKHCLDTQQCEEKLEQIFGFKVELNNHFVCRACWKLVELITDFRQSCLLANEWASQNDKNLSINQSDDWLSSSVFDVITQTHNIILGHMDYFQDKKQRTLLTKPKPKQVNKNSTGKRGRPAKSLPKKQNNYVRKTVKKVSDQSKDKVIKKRQQLEKSKEAEKESKSFVPVDELNIEIATCEKCNRRFDTKIGYWVHVKSCNATENASSKKAPHACTICSATFTEPRLLKFHINKHKGIKPYKCRKECNNWFYGTTARISHERTCGSKLEICPLCGVQLKTIYQHMSTVHGVAKVACEICGRLFKSKKALTPHLLVHTGIRKYPCKICGKPYKSSYAVKVHLRSHTQEKPYECTICGAAYAYKVLLKSHIERKHGQSLGS